MGGLLARFRGQGYKTRLLNPHDEYWDRRLGIRTFGFHEGSGAQGEAVWNVHYTPTPYADILRLLRHAGLHKDDVFVDLGAGMGRAVFTAAWLGARRSVGVELIPELVAKAEANRARARQADRDISFVCTDATRYAFADMTMLFMFHPFGETTMEQVLRNIRASREAACTPPLRIVYINPVCDEVLAQSGWLRRIERLPPPDRRLLSTAGHHETSIWQSI